MGRNLLCLEHCSISKTLLHLAHRGSVNAHQIHTGERQGLGTGGQPCGTFQSPLPSLLIPAGPPKPCGTALPEQRPPHQGRAVWEQPRPWLCLSARRKTAQLGGEAVAEQRHLAQEGVAGGALKRWDKGN